LCSIKLLKKVEIFLNGAAGKVGEGISLFSLFQFHPDIALSDVPG